MECTVEKGWLQGARRVPSPNREPRPAGCVPELLVLHNISLPPGCYGGDSIERLFTNQLDWDAHPYFQEIRGLRVSAHLLIRRDGELLQFVDLNERAWHAGRSCYRGRSECNDFSIGIELEGSDDEPFTDAQYHALTAVSASCASSASVSSQSSSIRATRVRHAGASSSTRRARMRSQVGGVCSPCTACSSGTTITSAVP